MVGAVILAAGLSKRMGKSKLTLMLDGLPIVEHVINSVEASDIDSIVIVYSSYTKDVEEIADRHGIKAIKNAKADKGMSTSVKCGLESVLGEQGIMFLLGDQPFIETGDINKLIAQFRQNRDKIIVPVSYNERGNPVIFPEKFYNEIMGIEGDKGARKLIEKYSSEVVFVEVDARRIHFDIDTIEDLKEAKKRI